MNSPSARPPLRTEMSYSPGYGGPPSSSSPRAGFGGAGSAAAPGGLALTSSLLASPRFARRAARASPASVTSALGAASGIYSSPAGRRAELDRLVSAASPTAPSPTLARQRASLAQDVASLSADLDKLQRGSASREAELAARASVSQAQLHREAAQVVSLEHQLSQHKEAALQTYAQEIDSLRSSMTRAASEWHSTLDVSSQVGCCHFVAEHSLRASPPPRSPPPPCPSR